MNYLLDTHIWLWSLLEPEKLNKNVIQIFESPTSQFFISPISIWETMILAEKGRIELDAPSEQWVLEALNKTQIKEAKLSHAIAIKSRLLEVSHQDPADRFIAATAWEYDLTLITEDEKLCLSKQIRILS